MARLNLEDKFFLDVLMIAGKFANQCEAVGNAVLFFRHAQEKHKYGELISEMEFEALGFSEALIPVFAERLPEGIRARGSEKFFDWLKTRVENGKKTKRKTKQPIANDSKPTQAGTSPSYSSSSSINPKREASGDALPMLAIIWNNNCGKLPKVQVMNAKRLRLANQRYRETGVSEWTEIVQRIAASDFCNGKNDRGWRADFDFLIQDTTRAKVREGKYDNRRNGPTGRSTVAPPPTNGPLHIDAASGGSVEREEINLTDEERAARAARVRELMKGVKSA
jgi:hypothetical protein